MKLICPKSDRNSNNCKICTHSIIHHEKHQCFGGRCEGETIDCINSIKLERKEKLKKIHEL